MSAYESTGHQSGPTTDGPRTETAYLSQVVTGTLHFDELPDFGVWMAVGESSQITIERVAEVL